MCLMRGICVLLGFLATFGMVPSAPAQTPVSQLIVGKWKSLETNDDAVVEFLKDGKMRIVAPQITIEGNYKFANESEMELNVVIAGKENTLKFKVTIADDTMTTQEIGKQKTERFKRVK